MLYTIEQNVQPCHGSGS